jgi:hypothetical protein
MTPVRICIDDSEEGRHPVIGQHRKVLYQDSKLPDERWDGRQSDSLAHGGLGGRPTVKAKIALSKLNRNPIRDEHLQRGGR